MHCLLKLSETLGQVFFYAQVHNRALGGCQVFFIGLWRPDLPEAVHPEPERI